MPDKRLTVGDRVRINDQVIKTYRATNPIRAGMCGKTGTIIQDDHTGVPYLLDIDGEGVVSNASWWRPQFLNKIRTAQELEKAQPETRLFKIGDTVRSKSSGRQGVITKIEEGRQWCIVSSKDSQGWTRNFTKHFDKIDLVYHAPETIEESQSKPKTPPKPKTLRETWSADIVLASGRVVTLPSPDPEKWELVKEFKNLEIVKLSVAVQKATKDSVVAVLMRGSVGNSVCHNEGLCWLDDMARIVNTVEKLSPFETRWSYITKLYHWREKPERQQERYSGCDSVLSNLW